MFIYCTVSGFTHENCKPALLFVHGPYFTLYGSNIYNSQPQSLHIQLLYGRHIDCLEENDAMQILLSCGI